MKTTQLCFLETYFCIEGFHRYLIEQLQIHTVQKNMCRQDSSVRIVMSPWENTAVEVASPKLDLR